MSLLDNSEANLLLLLSDSNLPTGSFVASSGLESFLKHGFSSSSSIQESTNSASNTETIINFVRDSLCTYASSALPFVSDAHTLVASSDLSDASLDIPDRLNALDDLYDSMTLNHVAKRASKAQGVALLTLYSKGFSRPPGFSSLSLSTGTEQMAKLVDAYKLRVRSEVAPGHLPVCWGILCAALSMSLGRLSSFQ